MVDGFGDLGPASALRAHPLRLSPKADCGGWFVHVSVLRELLLFACSDVFDPDISVADERGFPVEAEPTIVVAVGAGTGVSE